MLTSVCVRQGEGGERRPDHQHGDSTHTLDPHTDTLTNNMKIFLQASWWPQGIKFHSHSRPDLFLVVLAVMAMILSSSEGCDYSHIDPMHTMCIFAPRMCHKKKLLRKFQFKPLF